MRVTLKDGSYLITGALGKDAEYKTVGEKNSSLTKFSVMVAELRSVYGKKQEAVWMNCQCWHSLARGAACLKKGDVVLCIGNINWHRYNGKDYATLDCNFVTKALSEPESTALSGAEPIIIPDEYEEILSDEDSPF